MGILDPFVKDYRTCTQIKSEESHRQSDREREITCVRVCGECVSVYVYQIDSFYVPHESHIIANHIKTRLQLM